MTSFCKVIAIKEKIDEAARQALVDHKNKNSREEKILKDKELELETYRKITGRKPPKWKAWKKRLMWLTGAMTLLGLCLWWYIKTREEREAVSVDSIRISQTRSDIYEKGMNGLVEYFRDGDHHLDDDLNHISLEEFNKAAKDDAISDEALLVLNSFMLFDINYRLLNEVTTDGARDFIDQTQVSISDMTHAVLQNPEDKTYYDENGQNISYRVMPYKRSICNSLMSVDHGYPIKLNFDRTSGLEVFEWNNSLWSVAVGDEGDKNVMYFSSLSNGTSFTVGLGNVNNTDFGAIDIHETKEGSGVFEVAIIANSKGINVEDVPGILGTKVIEINDEKHFFQDPQNNINRLVVNGQRVEIRNGEAKFPLMLIKATVDLNNMGELFDPEYNVPIQKIMINLPRSDAKREFKDKLADQGGNKPTFKSLTRISDGRYAIINADKSIGYPTAFDIDTRGVIGDSGYATVTFLGEENGIARAWTRAVGNNLENALARVSSMPRLKIVGSDTDGKDVFLVGYDINNYDIFDKYHIFKIDKDEFDAGNYSNYQVAKIAFTGFKKAPDINSISVYGDRIYVGAKSGGDSYLLPIKPGLINEGQIKIDNAEPLD